MINLPLQNCLQLPQLVNVLCQQLSNVATSHHEWQNFGGGLTVDDATDFWPQKHFFANSVQG